MKQIAVLGAGGMGTALAVLFARAAHTVRLWARDHATASEMARTGENSRHLPGIRLPDHVLVTSAAKEACQSADLIVIAIPSSYLRVTLAGVSSAVPPSVPMLSVVKGIENETFARPSGISLETLGQRPVAILSGPSHAEEISRGLPASVVVAGTDEPLCGSIRDTLNHGMFRVYTNPDAVGVELAGALKNILGIAAGVCDGLGLGDNAKAAVLTRGLAEISRFGVSMGANPSTFFGLAGVGDVITTCYSKFGRNRMVGERIGRGESLDQVLGDMVNVAEGVPTTRSVHHQARSRGIDVPITDELYEILFEGKPPRSVIADLMVRNPKVEWAL